MTRSAGCRSCGRNRSRLRENADSSSSSSSPTSPMLATPCLPVPQELRTSLGGQTWSALGGALDLDALGENSDDPHAGHRLKLSGVNQTIIALVLGSNWRGRIATIYHTAFDQATGTVLVGSRQDLLGTDERRVPDGRIPGRVRRGLCRSQCAVHLEDRRAGQASGCALQSAVPPDCHPSGRGDWRHVLSERRQPCFSKSVLGSQDARGTHGAPASCDETGPEPRSGKRHTPRSRESVEYGSPATAASTSCPSSRREHGCRWVANRWCRHAGMGGPNIDPGHR
jgi:hypothetical protein